MTLIGSPTLFDKEPFFYGQFLRNAFVCSTPKSIKDACFSLDIVKSVAPIFLTGRNIIFFSFDLDIYLVSWARCIVINSACNISNAFLIGNASAYSKSSLRQTTQQSRKSISG